jgi:LytR cell envelope-related transcriptional attenuator
MHHVQEIGSYAGFAAIVGLAVLSALYFSQARDVKRLREWAGRAPERAAEEEARIASAATQQPRAAAGMGGAPAVAPAPPPTTLPGTGTATPVSGPGPLPRPVPTAAATPTTPILSRPLEPWYKRVVWPEGRYIALIVVGVIVIGAGAAYGISHLVNGGGSTPSAVGQSPSSPAGNKSGTTPKTNSAPRIVPANVTVAVLNGTTSTGLANQFADKVQAYGFKRGVTDNALTQGQQTESVVEYAHGNYAAAQLVGKKLGISQVERIDAPTQSRAGDANVVVVVGADKVPPATTG